jgi:hypothetical protein
MNKQTKMWLGIALVGVAGYMLYKQSKKPAASFSGGALGPREQFRKFASAASVVNGRMSTPGKQKFSVAQ